MFKSCSVSPGRAAIRIVGVLLLALSGLAGRAYSQCGSPANAIVAENCLTGNPSSEWDVGPNSNGDSTIQGFATDMSVAQGGTIGFKINTPASGYTITIYRMGYYGGMGARKIATVTPSVPLPQSQPACLTDTTTGLIDCGNWAVTATWQVPSTAVSGIYFAHLVRNDTGGDSHIVFIVRNDTSHSAILYQTSDESWQAYNYYGAGSLYGQATPFFNLNNRSFKVSYNRPFFTRGFQQESDTFLFGSEFPMVQWLEANGYDVTYFTSVDAARNGALIQNHKVFMDSGHDEYWSGPRRANVQAARDAGVNLAFFSGNEVFWKTRWENSIDGTNTPYRTLVCYKETLSFAKTDPTPTWTGTWRDPSFSPPSDGGQPENALTGTLFMVNGTGPDNEGDQRITVPAADGQMRFWRNTPVASLAANSSYTLPVGTLGYEWDVDADNGFRPAGAFHLSTTTYTLTSDYLLDYGATYGAGVATHHLMTYRAPSGALVFGAGTVNWSWGLNSNHDNPFSYNTPNPDPVMQQATVNLFADMGVQPTTLQSGLVPATASTDTTPPVSVITSPSGGASLTTGNTITVTGTASDAGGVVAGVEVSGDGGATWHPATGRATWSYSWTPTVVGSPTLLSRAVDDSGNIEKPSDAIVLNVAPQTCPCSIWNGTRTPTSTDSGDGNSVEVGVKFRADANGSVLGVRFYKAATNTGTHVGHIWTSTGTLLGTATFTSESGSGWQQVFFSAPIPVVANTTYVVSYFAPKGHYAADPYYFATSGTDNPPLHALATGVDGQNGLFFYGSAGGFPTSSYLASNYWVDVIFTSSNTYNITGTISGYGGGGASVTLGGTESAMVVADSSGNYAFNGVVDGSYTVTPAFAGVSFTPASQPVTVQDASVSGVNFAAVVTNPLSISGTITGAPGATVNLGGSVTASMTADASGNYSFQGLLGGTYTVTPLLSGVLFTPGTQTVPLSGTSAGGINFQGQVCNCTSIWQPSVAPTLIDANDGTPIEVGVLFKSDVQGLVDGIRFYKAATNQGTHIGHLWSSTGALLAAATFTNETASGWQQVNFATPVQIYANTTYIASYFAPVGHYSADTKFFATSGVDSVPLHALQDGVSGANGIYNYTSSGTFPNSTYASTNYWVDVVFSASASYALSGTIAGGPGASVTLLGSNQPAVTADASGNYTFNKVYSGSYSVLPSSPGLVFSPGNQNVTVGSAAVTGVNFTVPQICPCDTIWTPAATPTLIDSGDGLSYELGTKFRADTDGYILGVRFYKSTANIGTHIGNLWSNSNLASPIATSTFSNESLSGWQQVLFNSPVPVSANTTYIGSYFSPNGHYSVDRGYFATGVDTPPLHALANGIDGSNGVYSQSSMSSFPSSTYEDGNYWVDVIYAITGTHSLGGTITGLGVAGVPITLTGAANAATTTDAYGNYNFNGLADGTYTVTPAEPGFIISPASQTTTISGAHNLDVNFTSALPTYPVSGTVAGGPGIAVTLTGTVTTTASSMTATVTADASGNYTFPAVPNGSFTIAPSTIGYSVTPANQSVAVNGAAIAGINFNAVALYYSIGGTITGGAGATVTLTGNNTTVTAAADGSGNYTIPQVLVGTYVVTPSLAGAVFNPANITLTLVNANAAGVNFAVPTNCPCDTIWAPSVTPTLIDSGDIHSVETGVRFRADADAYITGLRFYKAATNTGTHIGNLWSGTGQLLGTATFVNESGSGWQQVFFAAPIPVHANTTYIASYFSPVGHYSGDTGFFLNAGVDTPPLHALSNGVDGLNGVYAYSTTSAFPTTSANAANYWVDVIYTPSATYSVAGNIAGPGGPGATVALSGASTATTTADQFGNFSFAGLANGTFTVTPSLAGYVLSPATQTAAINNSHALGLAFTSVPQTYTIGGAVTGAGAVGATITLSGAATATATVSASGTYSFTGLANGTYTVTAANTGFVATPASQAVTLAGANATANFVVTPPTYSIGGVISGPGASGATLTLTGAATATTTANATGTYTFPGLPPGTYNVTPSATGAVFTPATLTVAVSAANVTGVSFTIPSNCPCNTIFQPSSAPVNADLNLNASLEVGVKFTADSSGYITGVRFYKGPTNTGTHVGNLWSSTGTLLGTTTFSGESASGWQQAFFPTPIPVMANSVYVISYSAPNGYVAGDGSYFTSAVNSAPLHALADGASGPNGVYAVGAGNFPSNGAGAANYWVDAVYTPTATYTVSGVISGPGGSGAAVALTGAASATTTADTSGKFSFPGLANGTYALTFSKAGYNYTPATQSVTVNNTHVLGIAISSALKTYAISGTVTGAGALGATVTLSGIASATTTTSSAGAYSFAALANGVYTVAIAKAGYLYTPRSQSVTVSGGSATANFSSAQNTYTLSGTVTGAAASGTTITLTGASSATTTTNATGTYSLTGLVNGTYTVTAAKAGYAFTPASQSVTVSAGNAAANFASAGGLAITGTISGGAGAGVTVSLAGAATATATTNASGGYSFASLVPGVYTVTAAKTGYVFAPVSQAVTLTAANGTANFTSTAVYNITGTISGAGGAGATVNVTGTAAATTTANSSGAYSLVGLPNGTYTVTPARVGYIFTPASQAVTIRSGNVTANFTSAVPTYTISGTISGNGGAGAAVKLTGAATQTVTANNSGAYSLTAVPNGSYTVTITKTGYAFTPPSQSVIVNGGNAVVNFAATTYTLSGTISGAGVSGVTISVTGSATLTTTTNSSGAYSLSGVPTGSYTVKASHTGYAISPASQAVTISTANATANFSSLANVACHVTYSLTTQWSGGFQTAISIQNAGALNLTSWTLRFTFPGNQKVTQSWNSSYSQSGQNVTMTNASYNGSIPSGTTFTGIGFNGSFSGSSNPAPTSFSINGTPCQ